MYEDFDRRIKEEHKYTKIEVTFYDGKVLKYESVKDSDVNFGDASNYFIIRTNAGMIYRYNVKDIQQIWTVG